MVSMFLNRNLEEDSEIHVDYVDPDQDAQRTYAEAKAATQRLTDIDFSGRLHNILADIELPTGYRFILGRDQNPYGRFFFQVEGTRRNPLNGDNELIPGRPDYLHEDDTTTDLVRVLFRLYDTYCRDEAAETFLWRERPALGPHIPVEAHWNMALRYDARTACPPPGTAAPKNQDEFLARLNRIRADVTLPEQFKVIIDRDKKIPHGRFYFQIEAQRIDTFTGDIGTGRGGKAYLSDDATDSELTQIIAGLYEGYAHHEARETFLWRGRRIYGPHVSIDAHWEAAEHYEAPTFSQPTAPQSVM